MINYIDKFFTYILKKFIIIYQYTLSPDKWIFSYLLKWKICIHTPHCSQYWLDVLNRYWFFNWIIKIMDRITSCHPLNKNTYDPAYYNVVFLSNYFVWIDYLNELFSDKIFEVKWVVTYPPKPIWRKQKLEENIIHTTAKNLWIEKIFLFDKSKFDKKTLYSQIQQLFENDNIDYFVVVSFWEIIPQSMIDFPKIWTINVHYSNLPQYRWASPVQSVLLDWQQKTWVSIMLMAKQMDTWDILYNKTIDIEKNWTSIDLFKKSNDIWKKLLTLSLKEYWKKLILWQPQDHSKATFCKKFEKKDWLIDVYWETLEVVFNKFKAFYIWPNIFFMLDKNFWKIWWKIIKIENIKINFEKFENFKNYPIFDNQFKLNESIIDLSLKIEWKNTISWKEFKNWYTEIQQK